MTMRNSKPKLNKQIPAESMIVAIDPIHASFDLFGQQITQEVWKDKYCYDNEASPQATFDRVVDAIYAEDLNTEQRSAAFRAMSLGLWVPAGRILAGAGTTNIVTLLNCYVSCTIGDSMDKIADALKEAMLTQQQGGGIGMNFSTLRPRGAYLKRTGAVASGPLPFMDMWDAMCATIMSAGSRRGAMMGTMRIDHPDIIEFIEAKHKRGRLTNFNISVLVTDDFMDAVQNDEEWCVGFNVPRADGNHVSVVQLDNKEEWYVYAVYKARELWEKIIQYTYEFSEPGVIFIDRINRLNNLNYVETISCTNPCGEQVLPPYGACDLGAVNLARLVKDPFTPTATFNMELLRTVASIGTRFLDNVLDVTNYPLEEQKEESMNKRRIGLGITGLGNALAQLNLRYGSEAAIQMTNTIMHNLKVATYTTSYELAKERGPFPLWGANEWAKNSPVFASLPQQLQQDIRKDGIRNGVLLTVAPTGTTSILMGNCSSGLEPIFMHQYRRKVRQLDNSFKEYTVIDYNTILLQHIGSPEMAAHAAQYNITAGDLTVQDHLRMQAVVQKHIDSSVSKTINCPIDMAFEDFQLVYYDAYTQGCKGCTTYRPNPIRGSILSDGGGAPTGLAAEAIHHTLRKRPNRIVGSTYKLEWPNEDARYYVTINDFEGTPYEIFIHSTSAKYNDWSTALSLMLSAIMRRGDDITFVPEELMKVASVSDQAWVNGRRYGSLVALIGDTIKQHLECDSAFSADQPPELLESNIQGNQPAPIGDICPRCNQPTFIRQEGCSVCLNCSHTSCG